jgi:hypothetical protein
MAKAADRTRLTQVDFGAFFTDEQNLNRTADLQPPFRIVARFTRRWTPRPGQ